MDSSPPDQVAPDGPATNSYYIQSNLKDGFVLTVQNAADGSKIVVMDNKKSPPSNNQKWFLQYLIANKTTAIISMTTGSDSTQFALDGGAQGNPLVLSAFNGNPKPSQQWIDHDNYWQFASDPTLVMDVAGANTTAGTSVILWPRNSPPSNNQQFTKEDTPAGKCAEAPRPCTVL
ncbi:hypothetical protein EMCRGX_G025960 [Ephydatia muelleri]